MRYHGGKWRLSPWIIGLMQSHRTYVEPFGGAGSVLLRKPRSYAEIYNDLDGEIVNLFRVLRDPTLAAELRNAVALTPYAREEFKNSYVPTTLCPVESARRTLVRAHMGFSTSAAGRKTGFRSSSKRNGSTPAQDWANWPLEISHFTERLRGVTIENGPALELMEAHDSPETLFYVDPPYVKGSRSDKGDDYRHEMTDVQHEELLEKLESLDGMVMLSGYDSVIYGDMAGWIRHERSALADGAGRRTEVLWTRNIKSNELF